MGGGLSRISSGKSRGLRRSSSHQEVNSPEVLKTRSASKRADNQTRSWGSISLLRRKQPAETRAEIAPTKTHAETDLAADRQMADDQHMAEGDASPASRRSGEGGDQQLWTQRQQALRQADTLQNKSLDSVGLAALIQQHDSEAAGVGAGGKPRPPSIDVLCAGDTAYSSSSAATPFHRCASLSNAPTERPPFALFEGRQVQETWAVMTADLKEVGSIDVLRADGYAMAVADISVNHSTKTVAVANKSGEAHMFAIDTGKVQCEVGEPVRLPLTSIAHNCNGTLLVTGGSDKTLRLYDAVTGKELGSSSAHQSFVTCVAFASHNPSLLASGGGDKPIVRVWKVGDKHPQSGTAELLEQCVLVGHWAFLTRVAFSSDDRFLATSSMDWTIRVWDIENGEPMVNMSFSAALVQDRTRMQVGKLSHINHRQMEEELVSDGSDVRFTWERPDFDEPLRLCRVPDTDGWGRQVESRFQYVEVDKGRVIYTSSGWLRTLKGHCGPVNHVEWSPDGKYLVSAGDDGTVRLWDAQCELNDELVLDDRFLEGTEGHHVLAIEDEMVPGEEACTMRIEADECVQNYKIKFSEDGGFYKHTGGILGSGFNRIRRPACQFVDRFRNPVYQIIREADDKVIFDTNFSKFTLWGHQGPVTSARFWGEKILSTSDDGTLRMWNPENLECLFVVAATARYPLCSLTVCEEAPEAVLVGDRKGGVSILLAEDFGL